LDQYFAVHLTSKVGVDIESFDVWISLFEVIFHLLQILDSGESIEDNVIASFGERVGNAESDSAERASDNCSLIAISE
jgi:hypothetical protein